MSGLLVGRTAEQGSRTLVAAAVAGEESHGMYMCDCKVGRVSRWVESGEGEEVRERVWEELLGVLEGIQPGIGNNV